MTASASTRLSILARSSWSVRWCRSPRRRPPGPHGAAIPRTAAPMKRLLDRSLQRRQDLGSVVAQILGAVMATNLTRTEIKLFYEVSNEAQIQGPSRREILPREAEVTFVDGKFCGMTVRGPLIRDGQAKADQDREVTITRRASLPPWAETLTRDRPR